MKLSNCNRPIFFAVGGTGGHLYPAQVLYERLLRKNRDSEVWFLGKNLNKNPYLETKFKENEQGLHIREIASAPFSKNPLKSLMSLGKLTTGFFQAAYWVLKKRPKSVVGFGSFYSAPTLLAALIFRVPVFLYESDLKPGIANRIFTPFAKKIGVCFIPRSELKKKAKPELGDRVKVKKNQKKVQVEPLLRGGSVDSVRCLDKKKSYSYFGLDPKKKTLLVFGGSQGATFINESVSKAAQNMEAWTKTWQVLHLAGKNSSLLILEQRYKKAGFSVCIKAFEEHMFFALAISDLAICRAGSSSILELMAYEVPALFIPYPYAYNHQDLNALFMVAIGAGKCLKQSLASIEVLKEQIEALIKDEKLLGGMREAMSKYKKAQKPVAFEELIMSYEGMED